MSTITIQIGNTDNKLTQKEWSEFVFDVNVAINRLTVHFRGGAAADSPFQNYCWVVEEHHNLVLRREFIAKLKSLAARYRQDSIAVTIGETEFVTP